MIFSMLATMLIPWGYVVDSLRMGLAWDNIGGISDRASTPLYYWLMILIFSCMGIFMSAILFPLLISRIWP